MEKQGFEIRGTTGNKVYEGMIQDFKQDRFFDGPVGSTASGGDLLMIYGEKYYYRNKSRILATMIIQHCQQDCCRVNIILGGGSGGLTATLGSEKSLMKKLTRRLEKICEQESWEIKRIT